MRGLRFKLARSHRICCRGHTSTFEIEGVNEASREWLADWTLYGDTCQALTLDVGQYRAMNQQT